MTHTLNSDAHTHTHTVATTTGEMQIFFVFFQKKKKKYLRFMDAGIAFNLPYPPLMRLERGVDLIIALDQSSSPRCNKKNKIKNN